MFSFGHSNISYTHHPSPITIPTKKGPKAAFSDIVKSVTPPCNLNPLLFNGHLQTMWTAVVTAGPEVYYKRQIFESTHSIYPGQFVVDFVVSKEEGEACDTDDSLPERTTFYSEKEIEVIGSEDDTPMLVCLHGLSGGSHEVYLREVVGPITAAGWAACVVTGRGCAMSKVTTPRLFNARSTWDVRQAVHYLRKTFPNRPLYAVGFSMGANILTNYISEEGEKCEFKAAVVCSNPWDLNVCNVGLKRTWLGHEVYCKVMGSSMKRLYEANKDMIDKEPKVDKKAIDGITYLYEFDRVIQAPTWGYPSEGAYHRDAQSADAVVAIKIPFFAINAEDDPISQIEAVPFEEFKHNPYTVLCTTSLGGHVSWFQLGGKRWFATASIAYLLKMHEEVDLTVKIAESIEKEVQANGEAPEKKFPVFDACNRRLICPLE